MVAIVGRPNVGKSTLVNRIVGRREAIVEEQPGRHPRPQGGRGRVGRPSRSARRHRRLVPGGSDLDAKVSRQTEQAIREADVVLFVVDATIGVTDEDSRVAGSCAAARGTVLLVANKVDDADREAHDLGLLPLGLGDPLRSARCTAGAPATCSTVVELLPARAAEPTRGRRASGPDEGRAVFAVAIVGRPNVGKSTLFNRLIGDERAVVHDLPGTTRDTIDTVVETDDGPLRFIDTAGHAPQGAVDEGTEYYSLVRALQAVDRRRRRPARDRRHRGRHRAGPAPRRAGRRRRLPDRRAAQQVGLLDAEERADVTYQVARRLHFLGEAPVLKICALTRQGRAQAAAGARRGASRRTTGGCPTRQVNEVIRAAQQAAARPRTAGRVLYATQGAADPPTFTLFANRGCRRPTCATSSAGSARRSTSGPPRSSSGSVGGRSAARPCPRTSPPSSSATRRSVARLVYEFWCAHGHGPNLRRGARATGLDRRTIVQAYKELQLGIICVVDQDSQNCNLLKFQPFSSFPSQVEV